MDKQLSPHQTVPELRGAPSIVRPVVASSSRRFLISGMFGCAAAGAVYFYFNGIVQSVWEQQNIQLQQSFAPLPAVTKVETFVPPSTRKRNIFQPPLASPQGATEVLHTRALDRIRMGWNAAVAEVYVAAVNFTHEASARRVAGCEAAVREEIDRRGLKLVTLSD